jgi:tetratricopeptide (TPR) repeat protein
VAVRLLYRQQFEKARSAFEKVIATDGQDKEICERALTHLRLCQQKIARRPRAPRTTEEHYNVAITLINNGRYEESIHHLNRALKLSPKCDYVIYALAVSNCRLGNIESALKNLKLAINLKAENRFLAQRDADFAPLARDSRFISLIYPGEPSAATS